MKCLFWYRGSFTGVVKTAKFNILYLKLIPKYNFTPNMYDKKFDCLSITCTIIKIQTCFLLFSCSLMSHLNTSF